MEGPFVLCAPVSSWGLGSSLEEAVCCPGSCWHGIAVPRGGVSQEDRARGFQTMVPRDCNDSYESMNILVLGKLLSVLGYRAFLKERVGTLCLSLQTSAFRCLFLEHFREAMERTACVVLLLILSCPFCKRINLSLHVAKSWRGGGWVSLHKPLLQSVVFSLHHTAFGGSTGFWLKAVDELSQASVQSFCFLMQILLWQRFCFHLFKTEANSCDVISALNFSRG